MTSHDLTFYVGIGAGVFTTISLLPQLFKMIKEKKAEDISFTMLFVLLAGISGWIWYGILKTDYPIILTNSFSFIINVLLIVFSFTYKKNR